MVNGMRYYSQMIQSFADRETARLFTREIVGRFPTAIRRAALRKLMLIDAATALDDLRIPPGNRFERLRGDPNGQ